MNAAMDRLCRQHGYAAPVDVLMELGILTRREYEDWRFGRVDYLERVCHANLNKLSTVMRQIRVYGMKKGLRPSVCTYRRWGKGKSVPLRFSKSGDVGIERWYATHFVEEKMMKKADSDSTIMEYRLHLVLTSKELEETAEKYHFSGMDVRTGMEELQGIHEMLCKAADCRTVCMVEKEKREAAAVLTLGAGVDALQEEYQKQGLLMEAYLMDCLCRELLRKGSRALDERIRERMNLYAIRYLFPGQNLPLEEMERIFLCFDGKVPVKLHPGFVLIPRQSVAYRIVLSDREPETCADICADCVRRESCERYTSGERYGNREKTVDDAFPNTDLQPSEFH